MKDISCQPDVNRSRSTAWKQALTVSEAARRHRRRMNSSRHDSSLLLDRTSRGSLSHLAHQSQHARCRVSRMCEREEIDECKMIEWREEELNLLTKEDVHVTRRPTKRQRTRRIAKRAKRENTRKEVQVSERFSFIINVRPQKHTRTKESSVEEQDTTRLLP